MLDLVLHMGLLPCPFCGGDAEVRRIGTPRQSCIVGCTECHCTLESNENGAGHDWNIRASPFDTESVTRNPLPKEPMP